MNRKLFLLQLIACLILTVQIQANQDVNREKRVDEKNLHKLIAQLRDSNSVVRKNTCLAIEKYGVQAEKAIPLLEEIVVTDPAPEVKAEAGWALTSISGKIQAMKISTVKKESIHSPKLHVNSEGKVIGVFIVQMFGGSGGYLSAELANTVLVIVDERKLPQSQPLFAVGCYGDDSRSICFKARPRMCQYFITDKDYTVFPEDTVHVLPNGPFATIEVDVKGGREKSKPGAEVTLTRGKDIITKTTDANGIAIFQLSTVKTENITVGIVPAKGMPSMSWGSITTYVRGAAPDTVVYPVDVVLKD